MTFFFKYVFSLEKIKSAKCLINFGIENMWTEAKATGHMIFLREHATSEVLLVSYFTKTPLLWEYKEKVQPRTKKLMLEANIHQIGQGTLIYSEEKAVPVFSN